jgi:antitoxin CptB
MDAAALRWRCRRGMRELDQLMQRYLEHGWPQADDRERSAFLRLLDCEDDKLWAWCMGQERPDDPELSALVQRIVELPH